MNTNMRQTYKDNYKANSRHQFLLFSSRHG